MTDKRPIPTLRLDLAPGGIERLATLVQRGLVISLSGPVPLGDFLIRQAGFTPDYLTTTVQTIFVNGIPRDDLDSPIGPGDRVALSAAMPGLAGAIFRRAGAHASLRSRPAAPPAGEPAEPWIILKLFNRIGRDRGPDLLRQGFLIQGATLGRFLDRQGNRFPSLILSLSLDQTPLTTDEAGAMVAAHPLVRVVATER